MAAANSNEFGMRGFDPTEMDGSQSAIKLVKEDILQKHSVLPLYKRGGKLFRGTADPTNTHALDEIKFHANLVVEPILVAEDIIQRVMEQWQQSNDSLGDALGDDDDLDNLDISGGDEDAGGDAGVEAKGDEIGRAHV